MRLAAAFFLTISTLTACTGAPVSGVGFSGIGSEPSLSASPPPAAPATGYSTAAFSSASQPQQPVPAQSWTVEEQPDGSIVKTFTYDTAAAAGATALQYVPRFRGRVPTVHAASGSFFSGSLTSQAFKVKLPAGTAAAQVGHSGTSGGLRHVILDGEKSFAVFDPATLNLKGWAAMGREVAKLGAIAEAEIGCPPSRSARPEKHHASMWTIAIVIPLDCSTTAYR